MASAQQENTVLPQHEAIIDELLKKADQNGPRVRGKGQEDASMDGTVKNITRDLISFADSKDWSGSVFGGYPSSIKLGEKMTFSHSGTPPEDSKGSKGAVVYYGKNRQGGETNCAWVFAWSVPGDGSPNKVYVEAGPSTKYPKGSVKWANILASLDDEKTSSQSSYKDSDNTQAQASAKIDGKNDANAAVVFGV